MQFSCGNAVAKLLKMCGLDGWFSSSNTQNMTDSTTKIHKSLGLSHLFHTTIHTMIYRYGVVVSHIFHSTYNYNNLYKENCV